jgi:cytochrome c5
VRVDCRYNVRLSNALPQGLVMSEVHLEEHSSPIKTPKQLIIVILLSFLVPIILIVMLSQLVTTGINPGKETASTDEAVAARLKPIGQVEVTDPNAPKVEKTGKEVVDAVCSACHATGALNAPKIGDKAAWASHISVGLDHLTQNAIKGIRQMPARGGNPDLTDTEIARAIVFMANQSGASFKEPAAKAAPAADAKGKAK